MRVGVIHVAAAVLLLCAVQCAHAQVLGIDFGTQFIKISMVRHGAPIDIVLNERSKRKTAATLAFADGERKYGADAASYALRNPDKSFAHLKYLLGKAFDNEDVKALFRKRYFPFTFLPDAEGRGTVQMQVDDETSFDIEELVGMVLANGKRTAEANVGHPVKDCVITVPPFFSQLERRALLDSAELVGLNVLALINDDTAVALKYGMDHSMEPEDLTTVLFYDMGAGSTKASLVSYSSRVTVLSKKRNKTVGQLHMDAREWDSTLGGIEFDMRLVEMLADRFNEGPGAEAGLPDVRSNGRAMAKLRKEAERVKIVLSANEETTAQIEGIVGDTDFASVVTRAEFEEACSDLFERAVQPVRTLIKEQGVVVDDIDAIILFGGGSRVPRVQEVLRDVFDRPLDHTINTDEAAAVGAGLFAANMSRAFRVREFGVTDRTPFAIETRLYGTTEYTSVDPDTGAVVDEPVSKATLFDRYSRISLKRQMSVARDKDFSVVLKYRDDAPIPLGNDRTIARFKLTGIDEALKLNDTAKPKVNVVVSLDKSSIVDVYKSEALVTYTEEVEVSEEVEMTAEEIAEVEAAEKEAAEKEAAEKEAAAAEEGDAAAAEEGDAAAEEGDAAAAEEGDAAEEAAEAAEPVKRTKTVTKLVPKSRQTKVALQIDEDSSGLAVRRFTDSHRDASLARLEALDVADRLREAVAEARNSVESYVYGTRDRFYDVEHANEVCSEAQREEIDAMLDTVEEWLYDGVYEDGESLDAYTTKLGEMKALVEPVFTRAEQLEARPKMVEVWGEIRNLTLALVAKFEKERFNDTLVERTVITGMVNRTSEWVETVEAKQATLDLTDTPAWHTDELAGKMDRLRERVEELKRKPKPRVPKPKRKRKPKKPKKAENETITVEGAAGAENATRTDDAGAGATDIPIVDDAAAAKEGVDIPVVEDDAAAAEPVENVEPAESGAEESGAESDDKSGAVHDEL